MITFFTSLRPFVGEFDKLQRMAIMSWMETVPKAQVIVMGEPPGSHAAAQELDVIQCLDIERNEWGTPRVDSLFGLGERYATQEWLCEVSADIVLGADLRNVLQALDSVERPFVIGQRWDIEIGAAPETATLHPSCGIDYFLYRRGTLRTDDIPPFGVGKTMYDNWLVWAAMYRWDMTVIDATQALTAIHVNHTYIEYGDKGAMLKSQEHEENHRLAYATGMERHYGINDTPWVLGADLTLVQRGRALA